MSVPMMQVVIGTVLFYRGEIRIETLGGRIKRLRKLTERSQIDFSSRVGISQAMLSELEQDKYKPSVEIIISIVSEFHTDVTIAINEVNRGERKKTNFVLSAS